MIVIKDGKAELIEDDEYKKFSEFVVGVCTSFALSPEEKSNSIIDELITNTNKYPELNKLWNQCCGMFS